jgi:hypothetical protein
MIARLYFNPCDLTPPVTFAPDLPVIVVSQGRGTFFQGSNYRVDLSF